MSVAMDTQPALQLFLVRYCDLVERNIVTNRVTLKRWMDREDDPFPAAIQLGPNSIAWDSRAVATWVERRAGGDR